MAPTTENTHVFVPAWVWGPAGRDTELARAISDLTTGGFLGSTRDLLASVRRQDDRRAYCTSVLAAVLVSRRLDSAALWLTDEPGDPDALMLHARVLVVRAIHAARGMESHAQALAAHAARACQKAMLAAVGDPTPPVALLHLGETGLDLPGLRFNARTLDDLPINAPWNLLDEVLKRAPDHREAFHRLIPLCHVFSDTAPWRPDGPTPEQRQAANARARAQVAVWAADRAPAGSPLKLLRLWYAAERDPFSDKAEEMRLRNHLHVHGEASRERYLNDRVPAIEQRWRHALQATAVKLADRWFGGGGDPPYMPLSDISFLANYLYRCGELRTARLALEWMVPYATAQPWQREGDPGTVLATVCRQCHVNLAYLPRWPTHTPGPPRSGHCSTRRLPRCPYPCCR